MLLRNVSIHTSIHNILTQLTLQDIDEIYECKGNDIQRLSKKNGLEIFALKDVRNVTKNACEQHNVLFFFPWWFDNEHGEETSQNYLISKFSSLFQLRNLKADPQSFETYIICLSDLDFVLFQYIDSILILRDRISIDKSSSFMTLIKQVESERFYKEKLIRLRADSLQEN